MHRVTLAQSASLSGCGLFSGQPASLTIAPGSAGCGIVFDIAQLRIPATIDALSHRPVHPAFSQLKPRCTTLGSGDHSVATIEHIMSALAGLGITDAIIHVESQSEHPEIPIFDGSSKPMVDAILAAGLRTLDGSVEPIILSQPIRVGDGNASIVIEPSSSASYTYNLDYPGTSIAAASVTWSGDRDEYIEHVAPARTFSLQHEAQAMQSAGLFSHLSPSDMLVIGPDGPIDNAYRLPDECARHKLLDLIGDLALVGAPLIARVIATRSGHALAHEAALAICAQIHRAQ